MSEIGHIEYYRGGTGEPLVLLHGIGSCWQVWKPVIPALERHFDVIALDLPGFGLSAAVASEPTVMAIGEAVEQFLERIGLDTPHVAGNSMGGTIAAGMATHGLARSVTAISPGGLATKHEYDYALRLMRFTHWGARRLAPLSDAITATPAGRAAGFGWLMAYPWRISAAEAAHQMRMFGGSPSFAATGRWIDAARPMPPDLLEIDCPFTVLWGTRDLLLPVRQAARWGKLVPGARVILLPAAGHIPMGDAPSAVVAAIVETAGMAGVGRVGATREVAGMR